MIYDILKASGIKFRRGRFLKPPAETYAVYTDDVRTDGGDHVVGWYTHQITIELYEPAPDDEAEEALENAISEAGIQWEKQDRLWLQSEQRYQVVYEFEYIVKRRV